MAFHLCRAVVARRRLRPPFCCPSAQSLGDRAPRPTVAGGSVAWRSESNRRGRVRAWRGGVTALESSSRSRLRAPARLVHRSPEATRPATSVPARRSGVVDATPGTRDRRTRTEPSGRPESGGGPQTPLDCAFGAGTKKFAQTPHAARGIHLTRQKQPTSAAHRTQSNSKPAAALHT